MHVLLFMFVPFWYNKR